MRATIGAVTALSIFLFAGIATANTVQFVYISTVTSSAIPGVSAGDSVTVKILADNGGSSLSSQSWTVADFISGSLRSGTYMQSYIDGWFPFPTVLFSTDATGDIASADFEGTLYSPNHVDSFGTGPQINLYSDGFQDYFGDIAFETSCLDCDVHDWTVSEVQAVPEPSTLSYMILAALVSVMVFRRKLSAISATQIPQHRM
jgi:hypothetical protein